MVTEIVWDELTGEDANRHDPVRVQRLIAIQRQGDVDVIEFRPDEALMYYARRDELAGNMGRDRGEDSMMVIAIKRPEYTVVTSDNGAETSFQQGIGAERVWYFREFLRRHGLPREQRIEILDTLGSEGRAR